MASGNVTVITKSPRSKKQQSEKKSSSKKRKLDSAYNDENVDENNVRVTKSGRKKSKLTGTARRNERERNRVKQVNQGFAKLRDHVPKRGRGRKMSKVDILKSASDYIQNLQGMLDESDAVSAVMNIAALSANLAENGQLLDGSDSGDSTSNCESTSSNASSQSPIQEHFQFPCSPASYDCAHSPSNCSVDGSTGTSSASSICDHPVNSYSPQDHTLLDLATWFH
uniref:Achaete-scute A3 transcription factor n=1 Tax=Malacoceros fuliginosus TaxID=271776 RepID=A0A7G9UKX4_MALFL|nr:achaete-scute A3 transcription factor [Malacoceros fuliginosus]